jgi:hypothetical protein
MVMPPRRLYFCKLLSQACDRLINSVNSPAAASIAFFLSLSLLCGLPRPSLFSFKLFLFLPPLILASQKTLYEPPYSIYCGFGFFGSQAAAACKE